MNMLNELLKEGYVLSPFYEEEDVDLNTKIIKKDATEEELRELVRHYLRAKSLDSFLSDEGVVFFKPIEPYHITPEDLIVRFEEELKTYNDASKDDLLLWIDFLSTKTGKGYPFYPYFKGDPIQEDIDDYLFAKPDHIVDYIFWTMKIDHDDDRFKNALSSYITFLKETTSQEKKYSPSTLFYILMELNFAFYQKLEMSEEMKTFYHNKLLENANAGDLESMKMLAYDYYEGIDTFPLDPKESESWFLKNFSQTNDPEIARTLGYIYYYGKSTNGVPQKEKAFQYFAIGHFAGRFFEATYKLADCYVKGYGTPVCEKAAYNLVNSIYSQTFHQFLETDTSKYADVALRLASYYKDGIYVEKDLSQAHLLYLYAKTAIKKRLEKMDYIGDTGVAVGISKSLKEVEDTLGIEPRVFKDNGYVLSFDFRRDFENQKCEITGDENTLFINISSPEEDVAMLNTIPEIGFSEKAKQISFKLRCKGDLSDFIEIISSGEISEVQIFRGTLVVDVFTEGETRTALAYYDEIVVLPQTLKDPSKLYSLVTLTPFSNGKEYDYLCEDDSIQTGDTVYIETRNGKIETDVLKVSKLYEDQLPLPIAKMGKAYLIDNN